MRHSIQVLLAGMCMGMWTLSGMTEERSESPSKGIDVRRLALKKIKADTSLHIVDETDFFGQLDLERAELKRVREAVEIKDWSAAKTAWAKHLQERTSPQWLWSWHDREQIMQFEKEHGVNFASHVGAAEKVMRREFNFLGVHRKLQRDIAWEADEYEYEWCNVLNRHDYWRTLGFAWWQTGDSKYVKDWLLMLREWIADNPAGKGQPWRSLEVGIRAAGWFNILYTFMEAPEFDASMKYEMTRSLAEHARFLYKNNARFKKGNWQTAECSGLACVGIMLPEFKESAAWRARAFEKMGEHMRDGVYPDGAQYELTPGYHAWVMMEFLHLQKLAEKNGYKLPGLTERHEKMFEFLMQISTPDQRVMSHGDAGTSGGRSIKDNMGLGALLYGRPDMRYLATDTVPGDWIWLFSPKELAAYSQLPSTPPTTMSHLLPYAQYGVMRTGWNKKDRWLFFDGGPWGGAHSHADQLQILLYSGRDLVVDAGQISYDQPLAQTYYKSAQAHNGLLVNEQGVPRDVNPVLTGWCIKDRVEFAAGRVEHNGVTHQRSVLFVKPDYWVVIDHVSGKGTPTLTRLFHLPKGEVEKDVHAVRTGFKEGDNLSIQAGEDAVLDLRAAPLAGVSGNQPVAAFVTKQALPATLCTVLVPFKEKREIPKIERLPSHDPSMLSLRVTFEDGRTDSIAVATQEQNLQAGSHKGKGVALWSRNDAHGAVMELIPVTTISREKSESVQGAKKKKQGKLLTK